MDDKHKTEVAAFAKLLNESKPSERAYLLEMLKVETPAFCWVCGSDEDPRAFRGCQCENDE